MPEDELATLESAKNLKKLVEVFKGRAEGLLRSLISEGEFDAISGMSYQERRDWWLHLESPTKQAVFACYWLSGSFLQRKKTRYFLADIIAASKSLFQEELKRIDGDVEDTATNAKVTEENKKKLEEHVEKLEKDAEELKATVVLLKFAVILLKKSALTSQQKQERKAVRIMSIVVLDFIDNPYKESKAKDVVSDEKSRWNLAALLIEAFCAIGKHPEFILGKLSKLPKLNPLVEGFIKAKNQDLMEYLIHVPAVKVAEVLQEVASGSKKPGADNLVVLQKKIEDTINDLMWLSKYEQLIFPPKKVSDCASFMGTLDSMLAKVKAEISKRAEIEGRKRQQVREDFKAPTTQRVKDAVRPDPKAVPPAHEDLDKGPGEGEAVGVEKDPPKRPVSPTKS